MPYFENYNYEELKEKFVRSRFAETSLGEFPEVFIRNEREATFPSKNWESIGSIESPYSDWEVRHLLPILQSAVTPLKDPKQIQKFFAKAGFRDTWSIFSFAVPHFDFYPLNYPDYYAVTMVGKEKREIFEVINQAGPFFSRRLNAENVFYALLGEWRSNGPQRLVARQVLCALLDDLIQNKRVKAEKEFDEAVAVTEDGSKILSPPDKIIVFGGSFASGSARVYSGRDMGFWQRAKILRSHHMKRYSRHPRLLFMHNSETQVYVDGDNGTAFYTHKNFCPPDLPEPAK